MVDSRHGAQTPGHCAPSYMLHVTLMAAKSPKNQEKYSLYNILVAGNNKRGHVSGWVDAQVDVQGLRAIVWSPGCTGGLAGRVSETSLTQPPRISGGIGTER